MSFMANILILHGPNLNLLGERETLIYGKSTLKEIDKNLKQLADQLGHDIQCIQSNAEHELVEYIQKARKQHIHFIIINPAAFTHTSIALRDALLGVQIPFIEIHISNIQAREVFRHRSYLADIAAGCIFGFGVYSYDLALMAADHYLQSSS